MILVDLSIEIESGRIIVMQEILYGFSLQRMAMAHVTLVRQTK